MTWVNKTHEKPIFSWLELIRDNLSADPCTKESLEVLFAYIQSESLSGFLFFADYKIQLLMICYKESRCFCHMDHSWCEEITFSQSINYPSFLRKCNFSFSFYNAMSNAESSHIWTDGGTAKLWSFVEKRGNIGWNMMTPSWACIFSTINCMPVSSGKFILNPPHLLLQYLPYNLCVFYSISPLCCSTCCSNIQCLSVSSSCQETQTQRRPMKNDNKMAQI